jgi:hypothetical protein
MIVNELKTKVVIFGKQPQEAPSFIFNDESIDIVDSYKYVGNIFKSVILGHGDPMSLNHDYLSEQANKAMFAILKRTNAIGRLTPKVYLQLFDSYVTPILEYGSEIWYRGIDVKQIEKVQLRYLKMILKVKSSTSTLALYGDTGRFPLSLRLKVKQVKYWVRLVQLPDNAIVKQIYNTMVQLDSLNYKTWCSNVKNLLYEYGFGHFWVGQESLPANIVDIFKESVYRRFTNWWHDEINNIVKNPILRTYCQFKSTFGIEPYLLEVRDFKVRNSISKLRLSSHHLHVETGRHCRPKVPAERRLCMICNNGSVEDEKHFIEVCTAYSDLRHTLVRCLVQAKLINADTILVNMNHLLSSTNSLNQFYLGKFILKAFQRRTSILSRQGT